MRRVRSRLTILLLILVIVTSLFSLTFGALVRNGIIFQQRDNIRYLVFGYAAKDILLLLVAVAAVAVLITVTSRSTTNPIRELSRAAREIAGGNYDVTVPERDRVEEFGVSPAYRRQGIGEALVLRLVAELKSRGAYCLTLEVRDSNAPARALYEGLGFQEIGRRKNYYRNPREDALILRKEWSL